MSKTINRLNDISFDKIRVVTKNYDEKDDMTWGRDTACDILEVRVDSDGFMYIVTDAKEFSPVLG